MWKADAATSEGYAMKCNGCGEDFHGAASCLANMRWLLARAREEIELLKTVSPSVEVPVLLQKSSRSEQMKAIWAKRKADKLEV